MITPLAKPRSKSLTVLLLAVLSAALLFTLSPLTAVRAQATPEIEEIHEDMHKVAFSLRLTALATIGIFVVLLLNFIVGFVKKN